MFVYYCHIVFNLRMTHFGLKLNKLKKEIKIEPVKIIEYYCKAL
jgi:hypothetical protein